MYFKLTVVCKGANNELRKALTSKMIGGLSMDGYRINKSCILKFNNSLGFKNVVSLPNKFGGVITPKIESPKEYFSPYDLLLNNMQVSFDGDELVNFTVRKKYIRHTDTKYSYSTEEIIFKFKNFLEKVYPWTTAYIEEKETIDKATVEDFILNKFFVGFIERKSRFVTVEFSIPKLIEERHIQKIKSILNQGEKSEVSINQYYCETCKSNNPKTPYHIELI